MDINKTHDDITILFSVFDNLSDFNIEQQAPYQIGIHYLFFKCVNRVQMKKKTLQDKKQFLKIDLCNFQDTVCKITKLNYEELN